MFGPGWLKRFLKRKEEALKAEAAKRQAAIAEARRVYAMFTEPSADDDDRNEKTERLAVALLQATDGLADAFDPGWRKRGVCDLSQFPELKEFGVATIYADGRLLD